MDRPLLEDDRDARYASSSPLPAVGLDYPTDGAPPPTGARATPAARGGAGGAGRLVALDLLRGLAIVGMVVIDNQGSYRHAFRQLSEDFWNGLRLCNLFFPAFVFVAGVAVPLALGRRAREGRAWAAKTCLRAGKLLAIGIALNWMGTRFGDHVRLSGVLQRIAVCYATCASAFMLSGGRLWLGRAVTVSLCALYVALMYAYDVPGGCGRGNLTPACNAGAYFDRKLLGSFMYAGPNDPEGILSTCMAVLTMQLGVETGARCTTLRSRSLSRSQPGSRPSSVLADGVVIQSLSAGALLLAAGYMMHWCGMKLNKKIWSPSFTLVSAGYCLVAFSLLAFMLELHQLGQDDEREREHVHERRSTPVWTRPLLHLGSNALLIFVLMVFVEIVLLDWIRAGHTGQGHKSAWEWIFENAFSSWISDKPLASLVVSLVYLVLYELVAFGLFCKRWFWKA